MTGGTYFPLFIQLNHTNPSQTIATILNITKPRPTILTHRITKSVNVYQGPVAVAIIWDMETTSNFQWENYLAKSYYTHVTIQTWITWMKATFQHLAHRGGRPSKSWNQPSSANFGSRPPVNESPCLGPTLLDLKFRTWNVSYIYLKTNKVVIIIMICILNIIEFILSTKLFWSTL